MFLFDCGDHRVLVACDIDLRPVTDEVE